MTTVSAPRGVISARSIAGMGTWLTPRRPYLQALDGNPGDSVAMSNLVALYGQQGEAELAAGYRRRVDAHRMRNPYYRYRLAL